jgi:hypothetical protein
MAFIFCSNCGSKAEYSFSAPNFCSKCGESFSGKKNTPKFAPANQINPNVKDIDDEEESDNDSESFYSNSIRVPRIRNIEVDISNSEIGARIVKMSDLINGNHNQQPFKAGSRQNLNEAIDERKSN